ncbi:hypothetical protein [Natrinema hispanicum]|uniref:Uncharacterized protein n=1 Tax=Natrinema hispanicum TaxID=392421 RepID=A0A1G6ZJ41_9EURY|nr:hypothetical protein [Natrinema hispanicum]SDE02570.1 hypothetical protein SAMN05192552_11054 [Natrinema hispanicum]SEU07859.1 hypothetical protein SAMN04488694_13816 [Natrinema hispanicum]
MNQIESISVLFIGLGLITGSTATIQGFSRVVIPSVFLIGLGIVVAIVGKYR